MRLNHPGLLALVILALCSRWCAPAHASIVGIATDNASALPIAVQAVMAAGHTPQLVASLGASLAGIDVLWVLSAELGPPVIVQGNEANLASYVSGGGILSFHDRNVNFENLRSPAAYIPGAGGITFFSNFSENINVVTAGTLVTNGPAGSINDSTLDGGGFSNHGYATAATLPASSTVIFSDGDATHAVDFTYRFGAGAVYYSSIPLDLFLEGLGNDPPGTSMRTVYAPNEVAFQAGLLSPVAPIPEPASIVIWSVTSVLGLAQLRRRRKNAAT